MLYDIVIKGVHVESVYTTPDLLDEYMESAYGAVRDWCAAIPGEHHFVLSDDRGTDVIAYELEAMPD